MVNRNRLVASIALVIVGACGLRHPYASSQACGLRVELLRSVGRNAVHADSMLRAADRAGIIVQVWDSSSHGRRPLRGADVSIVDAGGGRGFLYADNTGPPAVQTFDTLVAGKVVAVVRLGAQADSVVLFARAGYRDTVDLLLASPHCAATRSS